MFYNILSKHLYILQDNCSYYPLRDSWLIFQIDTYIYLWKKKYVLVEVFNFRYVTRPIGTAIGNHWGILHTLVFSFYIFWRYIY